MNVHAVRLPVTVMAKIPGLMILRLIVDASVTRTTRLISTLSDSNSDQHECPRCCAWCECDRPDECNHVCEAIEYGEYE